MRPKTQARHLCDARAWAGTVLTAVGTSITPILTVTGHERPRRARIPWVSLGQGMMSVMLDNPPFRGYQRNGKEPRSQKHGSNHQPKGNQPASCAESETEEESVAEGSSMNKRVMSREQAQPTLLGCNGRIAAGAPFFGGAETRRSTVGVLPPPTRTQSPRTVASIPTHWWR